MAKVKVHVSVGDKHLKKMAQIAKQARKAGLEIHQQLDEVGVLTGVVDSKHVVALRKLPGVSAVEEERTVTVPPPDKDVQ